MTDCEMHIINYSSNSDQSLLSQLETTPHTLEQGMQLLSQPGFEDEHSLLSRFYSNICRYIRTLQYGFNDCTVPPVYVSSYTLLHTGLAGKPKILLNLDTVELLRSFGYDWSQIADALQTSRTTLWRRVKEAGCLIQKYSEISDDELECHEPNSKRASKLWSTVVMWIPERQRCVCSTLSPEGKYSKN